MRLFTLFALIGLISLACAAPGNEDEEDDDEDDAAELCDPDAGSVITGACTSVVEACQNYFDAYEDCYTAYAEAADIDVSGSFLSETYCEDTYGEIYDLESAAYLNCLADAWNEADCTDADEPPAPDVNECTIGE